MNDQFNNMTVRQLMDKIHAATGRMFDIDESLDNKMSQLAEYTEGRVQSVLYDVDAVPTVSYRILVGVDSDKIVVDVFPSISVAPVIQAFGKKARVHEDLWWHLWDDNHTVLHNALDVILRSEADDIRLQSDSFRFTPVRIVLE